MNADELRLFGSNMIVKSIKEYIDNHTDEFKELHNRFQQLTKNDPDVIHWHSDVDVYVKSVRLAEGPPKDTIRSKMYADGELQLKYIKENTNLNNNQILMNLYALQFFFEYGSQYFLNKNDNI